MTTTNFKSRLERRSRLLGMLRAEQHWTTSDLREHLNISQRTLMRELSGLKDEGFPIESDRGRGGGVRLAGRWGIERLMLSHKVKDAEIVSKSFKLRPELIANDPYDNYFSSI